MTNRSLSPVLYGWVVNESRSFLLGLLIKFTQVQAPVIISNSVHDERGQTTEASSQAG